MMARKKEQVAKVRITFERGGELWVLLSRKRSPKRPEKHDKLEMLGGRLKRGESPQKALIRELSEEEKSGLLSAKVCEADLKPLEFEAGGAYHYLFDLKITDAERALLDHDPEESLGFEPVRSAELKAGEHRVRLTPRTRKIMAALAEKETNG